MSPTQNSKPKMFFSLQTRSLAGSFEGLNSSPEELTSKLWSCKIWVCHTPTANILTIDTILIVLLKPVEAIRSLKVGAKVHVAFCFRYACVSILFVSRFFLVGILFFWQEFIIHGFFLHFAFFTSSICFGFFYFYTLFKTFFDPTKFSQLNFIHSLVYIGMLSYLNLPHVLCLFVLVF